MLLSDATYVIMRLEGPLSHRGPRGLCCWYCRAPRYPSCGRCRTKLLGR